MAGGGRGSSVQTSSDGLCSTLKTLLMSSSYRVRSATARLITSLCSDSPLPEESATADENAAVCGGGGAGGGGRKGSGLFFREVLIAAGATGNEVISSVSGDGQFQQDFRRAYLFTHVFSGLSCPGTSSRLCRPVSTPFLDLFILLDTTVLLLQQPGVYLTGTGRHKNGKCMASEVRKTHFSPWAAEFF